LRVSTRTQIAELQRRLHVTTVYVTHDQVEAMTMGDRVAVMRLGQLQQFAPPQELYDRPANVFVASFIGSPAMNLFSPTGTGAPHRLELVLGSQRLALGAARPSDLDAFSGRDVVVGIRPEDLTPVAKRAEPEREGVG